MKKDGTVYLCLIVFPRGNSQWDLLHWGFPAMGGGHTECWCYQNGLGARVKKIKDFIPLGEVLANR